MSEFNELEAIKAQKEYCQESGAPHFAPASGNCWNCRKNIYTAHKRTYNPGTQFEKEHTTGITVKKASEQLVTGCPHCNRSYCD
ncbi:hypothetical protein [Jeotgalibacillus campisalis]|uniref:hypothetical protein n=1 Tax=Jeotgalibacillus campisalis TaxID=220754 RepID=UPI000597DC44|nr:hypothetical protein [Jeotgalibacillus campisalis]